MMEIYNLDKAVALKEQLIDAQETLKILQACECRIGIIGRGLNTAKSDNGMYITYYTPLDTEMTSIAIDYYRKKIVDIKAEIGKL